MKYRADWGVNFGAVYGVFHGDNLAKMRREARQIALGNCPEGASGWWAVSLSSDHEMVLARGRVGRQVRRRIETEAAHIRAAMA